jgi:hypothetical protein
VIDYSREFIPAIIMREELIQHQIVEK